MKSQNFPISHSTKFLDMFQNFNLLSNFLRFQMYMYLILIQQELTTNQRTCLKLNQNEHLGDTHVLTCVCVFFFFFLCHFFHPSIPSLPSLSQFVWLSLFVLPVCFWTNMVMNFLSFHSTSWMIHVVNPFEPIVQVTLIVPCSACRRRRSN